MRTFMLAGVTALALVAAPAAVSAQTTAEGPPGSTNTVNDKRGAFEMNTMQRSEYERWPAEQRTMYDGLQSTDQEYYWTLDTRQRDAFRYLNPQQRVVLYQMTPEQQQQAWVAIIGQVQAMQNSATGQMAGNQTTGSQTASNQATYGQPAPGPANAQTNWGERSPAYTRQEIVQSTPMARQPSEYPICSGDRQDSCINPYAAGRRGPGVTKPLDYWPGRTSSDG